MSATALPILGPCQVWYGAAGLETEMGKTFGGVTFRCTEEAVNVFYDQFGTTPYNAYTVGKPTEVEANFANLNYTLFEDIMPNEATHYGDMPTPTPYAGDDTLDVHIGLGTDHRANSQRLILIPYVDGIASTDVEDRIYCPIAYPRINMELVFDAETQRVANTVFEVFPVSQATPRLWFMGDEANLP